MKEVMSLVDFAKAQRREDCPVCKLSPSVREQIAKSSDRKIRRRQVLDWLHAVVGVGITDAELTVHRNGRHDDDI